MGGVFQHTVDDLIFVDWRGNKPGANLPGGRAAFLTDWRADTAGKVVQGSEIEATVSHKIQIGFNLAENQKFEPPEKHHHWPDPAPLSF